MGHDGITPGKAQITANTRDLSTLGLLLGQDLSAFVPFTLNGTLLVSSPGRWMMTAQGKSGGHAFDFSADVKVAGQRYVLDKLTLDAGDNRLTANGAADLAEQSIKANISTPHLDIDQWPFAGFDSSAGSANGGHARLSSGRPVDLEFLKQWTIDVELRETRLRYRDYLLKDVRFEAITNGDALKIDARIAGLATTADRHPAWQLVEPLRIEAALKPVSGANAGAGRLTGRLRFRGLDAEFQTILPAGVDEPLSGSL